MLITNSPIVTTINNSIEANLHIPTPFDIVIITYIVDIDYL